MGVGVICPACKSAGDITAAVKRDLSRWPAISSPTVVKLHALHLAEARELHAKCRGRSWCDCQHVMPDEMQPEPELSAAAP